MRDALVSASTERAESETVERKSWRIGRIAFGRRGRVERVYARGWRKGAGVSGCRRDMSDGRRADVGVLRRAGVSFVRVIYYDGV